jgi:hypothetical protein
MQTITSDSHVIAALVKYAQELDTPSFDAAIDVYIAWGKTVNSHDRLLLCQALNDTIISTKVMDSRRSSRSLSSTLISRL